MDILISHRYCYKIYKELTRRLSYATVLLSNKNSNGDFGIPPEPTTCCMTGCANCVWISYAEELAKLYKGNGEKARQIILEKIEDPNLKMFLSIELKQISNKPEDTIK